MVQTSAGGMAKIDLGAIGQNVLPATDETYDLGSDDKKWAAIWVALALITSLTIGGVIGLSNVDGVLFINASTEVNGSLNVTENITVSNITADYYFGDGSQLTNIPAGTELDPHWTGNQSNYYNSTDILGFDYYNSTDFDINDYSTTAEMDGFSYWNDTHATFNKTYADTLYLTSFTELDPHWTGNETNVAFKNEVNVFTANQNLTGQNISTIDCIIFDSGGKICSGV